MKRCYIFTIGATALTLLSINVHSKTEKAATSKHITLEISRSATNQLHNNFFTPKVKKSIKELHEHIATIENSKTFGRAGTHEERRLIENLQNHRKNQKLYVTIQATSTNGTKETLSHFVMSDHGAKVPLTVPAIIPGKFRNEKTKSIIISISPIADLASAQKHNLVRVQEHMFKKLNNKENLHFSPSDYAAKKYAVKD